MQADLGQDVKVFSWLQPVHVGFAFTSQGAQWHAIDTRVFEYAVFRNTISYLDAILNIFPHPVS